MTTMSDSLAVSKVILRSQYGHHTARRDNQRLTNLCRNADFQAVAKGKVVSRLGNTLESRKFDKCQKHISP